jgi:outer membrane receptor protein involved in Fe transport
MARQHAVDAKFSMVSAALKAVVVLALWMVPLSVRAEPSREAAQSSSRPELGAHAVISVTPVLGVGVDQDRLPNNVQVLGGQTLDAQRSVGVQDALHTRLASVTINDVQGNPLQPDVQLRGFSASPLLGTPQGIAVYQNGVRVNEPFGDVVQWDLIPEFAVQEVQLIPGANPAFGLNSLGGSLALRMKDGYGFRGFSMRTLGGSFGRARGTLQYGGLVGDAAVYQGLDYLREDGFRDHSGTRALRLYADLRHAQKRFTYGMNLTLAGTTLRGNGPAPVQLLARDRSAVFTWPDITDNRLVSVTLLGDVELTRVLSLQSTAYVRSLRRDTVNGDEAEFEVCDNGVLLCDDNSRNPLLDEAGRPIRQSTGGDALLHTTETLSTSYGGTLQDTLTTRLVRRENQLSFGTTLDAADVGFEQHAEIGALTENRGVRGSDVFLGGAAYQTALNAQTVYLGAYATDTFSASEQLHVTLSGRLNRAHIALQDLQGAELDGVHDYTRINPAAGLVYQVLPWLTLYGGYSEANRVPSAAELACADPDVPCRVPNAFLSDPALKQVVSRALEFGLRGRQRWGHKRLRWSLAAFGSRNQDDILFVAGARIGTGYFRNAGQTQRLGIEANVEGRIGVLDVFASYQLLRASFESALRLPGDNHPRARVLGDGRRVIDIEPGDRMPGFPEHSIKAGFSVEPIDHLRLGSDARYSSAQYLRGDEANLLAPLDGSFVLDAHASYQVLPWLLLFVDAENLIDTRYETFGVLGDGQGVLPFATDPRFLGPGAPLGVWIGSEISL